MSFDTTEQPTILLKNLILKDTSNMSEGDQKDDIEQANKYENDCARILAAGLDRFFSGDLDHYFLAAKRNFEDPEAVKVYNEAKEAFSKHREQIEQKLRGELRDNQLVIAFGENILPKVMTTSVSSIWGEARSNLQNSKAQTANFNTTKEDETKNVMVIRLVDLGHNYSDSVRAEFLAVDFIKTYMGFGPLRSVVSKITGPLDGCVPA